MEMQFKFNYSKSSMQYIGLHMHIYELVLFIQNRAIFHYNNSSSSTSVHTYKPTSEYTFFKLYTPSIKFNKTF